MANFPNQAKRINELPTVGKDSFTDTDRIIIQNNNRTQTTTLSDLNGYFERSVPENIEVVELNIKDIAGATAAADFFTLNVEKNKVYVIDCDGYTFSADTKTFPIEFALLDVSEDQSFKDGGYLGIVLKPSRTTGGEAFTYQVGFPEGPCLRFGDISKYYGFNRFLLYSGFIKKIDNMYLEY